MVPPIATTIAEVRQRVAAARAAGASIGLVPTMGALHAGHVSLIEAARRETGLVVVSIFVNPTQFGLQEDFDRYPRQLYQDRRLCGQAGADLIFAPAVEEIYPPGNKTIVEVQDLQDGLCGASRPGHFRGVATVVLKLLHIVQPDVAFFGQKDGQQARIIQQMTHDLHLPLRIRVCPTVREPDGLALSSRNQYLDANQRRQATVLYQSLKEAQQLVEGGERDARAIERRLAERIAATPGAVLDYVQAVRVSDLQPVDCLAGEVMLALAVKFGATRLIDNIVLQVA